MRPLRKAPSEQSKHSSSALLWVDWYTTSQLHSALASSPPIDTCTPTTKIKPPQDHSVQRELALQMHPGRFKEPMNPHSRPFHPTDAQPPHTPRPSKCPTALPRAAATGSTHGPAAHDLPETKETDDAETDDMVCELQMRGTERLTLNQSLGDVDKIVHRFQLPGRVYEEPHSEHRRLRKRA